MSGPALLLALTAALATALATAPDPKPHNHHRYHRVHQEDLASQLERAPSPQQLEDVSKRSSIPSGTVCPNCLSHHHHHHGHARGSGFIPGQDKDLLRLEAIKQQILSKLGLATKPNVTSAVSRDVVLKTILRAHETSSSSEEHQQDTLPPPSSGIPSIDSEPDDFYGRTSEIIAFAEPGHTLNGQQLLEFPPPKGVEGPELRVKSAALWVRVDLSPSLSPDLLSRVRDRNLTLWIFRVSPSRLTNTTHLSGFR
ncbi:inhibin subunit beta isoform X2 [Lycorma delicatula]|uniref:inhibin subunit beta isoform X2 n=1 Tax=Lycorma delicatula TaxID=130591 RepID=UPI003F516A2B